MWKELQHKEWYNRGQDNLTSERDKQKEREETLKMWGK